MSLTEKGMVEGKLAGVRFDPEAPLRNTELFMTLYRLAGEPEVVPTFDFRGNFSDDVIINGKYGSELAGDDKYGTPHLRGKWYRDAAFWAAYNGLVTVSVAPPGTYYSEIRGTYRVGNENYSMPEAGTAFNDKDSYSVLIDLGDGYTTTRTDMIVALYLYVTEYLKKEVVVDKTTVTFADNAKIPTTDMHVFDKYISTPLYDSLEEIDEGHIWADAWNWAVGEDIIEGYPDNTLRPGATLTRAEYTVILERFMDYLK